MEEAVFKLRPYLFAVAYNILAEVQEAEDIVQESFEYYLSLKENYVKVPKSYLTRVVANKSIDRLKILKKQRESYPGIWLPEPYIHETRSEDMADEGIMNFEVLDALKSLNAVERAVFVLREAFNVPYSEVALICNVTTANCRQILKRTRQKIASPKAKKDVPDVEIIHLMENFLQAIIDEDLSVLTRLLKEDIVLYSDGGGKATAALHPLINKNIVTKFLFGLGRKNRDSPFTISFIRVNHQLGVLLSTSRGPENIMTFEVEQNSINKIYIIRNPDKLFFAKELSQSH